MAVRKIEKARPSDITNYFDYRDFRLTPQEITQLGRGMYIARFVMAQEGAHPQTNTWFTIESLVMNIEEVRENRNGVSDVMFTYPATMLSSKSSGLQTMHLRGNGIIPSEGYEIYDPLSGNSIVSTEGYIRPYLRTIEEAARLAQIGSIGLPR